MCACGSWIWADRAHRVQTCTSCGSPWAQVSGKPAKEWSHRSAWTQPEGIQPMQWPKGIRKVTFAEAPPPPPPGIPRPNRRATKKAQRTAPAPVLGEELLRKLHELGSSEIISELNAAGLHAPEPAAVAGEDAAQALFEGADAETRRLMQLAGLTPPTQEAPTPMEAVQAATKSYRLATQELRDLLVKKTSLKARCDKIKGQYEAALKDFAEVTEQIRAQEGEVEKAKSTLQMTADVPAPTLLPDVVSFLQQAGIQLTAEQQEAMQQHLRNAPQTQAQPQAPDVAMETPRMPVDPRVHPSDLPEGSAADIIRGLREDLRQTQEALVQLTQAQAQSNLPRGPEASAHQTPPAAGGMATNAEVQDEAAPPSLPAKKPKTKSKDDEGNRSRSPKNKSQTSATEG